MSEDEKAGRVALFAELLNGKILQRLSVIGEGWRELSYQEAASALVDPSAAVRIKPASPLVFYVKAREDLKEFYCKIPNECGYTVDELDESGYFRVEQPVSKPA